MNYFVTAIGTDSGKTLVSAILCQLLQADYWKPIQCGLPRDTETVKGLIDNNVSVMHEEGYFLKTPASPHAAAKIDGIHIDVSTIRLPLTKNECMIVEGAGGILVPLNDREVVIDLVWQLNLKVILVCDLYLGSINHSLLTIEYLKHKNFPIKGIVFNGESNKESEDIILKKSGLPCLFRVKKEKEINKHVVNEYIKNIHWYE